MLLSITDCNMLSSVLLVAASCAAQRGSRQGGWAGGRQGGRAARGDWDIRLAVPGQPGGDYPTHGGIPKTSFTCAGKSPGYYADIETDCQAFRVCTAGATFGFQSFLCPNGTLFNQAVVVCDWWMNVKCENTQQHIDDSNQKFSNLRVGTQFMHDIQKMLTHPMRNPYDQNLMKGNLIVMQEYRPPAGQLFPMSSLTFGSKNRPENVYVPSAKLVQQSFDNAISASTVSPLYSAPANRLQAPRGNELFQKQQQYVQSHRHNNGHYVQPNSIQSGKYVQPSLAQSGKYVEANHQENSQKYNQQTYAQNNQYQNHNYDQPSGNLHKNSQSSRLTQQQNAHFTNNALRQQQEQQQQILQQQQQLIQQQQQQQLQQLQQQQQQLQQQQQRLIQQNLNYNQGNLRYNQAQANIQQNELENQRGQVKQTAQYTDNSHSNNEKQKTQYDVEYTKQQYTVNQDKQNTFNASPYSNQINGKVSDEAKQNLALVFSFLTDSINQAREYKNIAEQNLLQSHTPFQNINNEELAKITNEVAQLTSAQFTANNNNNFNYQQQANIASTAQNINSNNQLGVSAKYTNNIPQHQVQQQTNLQSNSVSQQNLQSGQFQTTRFQGGQQDSLSANLQINNGNNQLYSGQLYQVPVPDVSSLYNGLGSGKLIAQNNNRQQHTEAADLHQGGGGNDIVKQLQSSGEVEIVQSQSVPYQAPAKLQAAPQTFNSQEDTQSILGNFASGNGISAQLSDKIVGTIPHPSEENKLVTYKKDQSYYVYTKLDDFHNNGLGRNTQANNGVIQGNNGGQSAKLTQSSNADNVVSFQLIPSVGYQLEDEREQQRLLNAFNIDEFTGSPRVQNQEVQGQNGNILTSNVEYSVEHPVSQGQYNRPSTLYAGPSSYSAPQASVGRLEQRAPAAAPAKIEQLEDNTNSNSGYSNGTPSRSFTFRK
ncbi:putative uncharacterized protein DDB_G0286901 [Plutella xylostella]|uniref:putative uncharacterized protein DDB_G0286901 n=1 Tax=Plutella xylostella TaxID=51655 RepID=UPI00203280E5|nr:putative uncharacterized protein DDB_G0286901 [Plutella xylostella]